MRTRTLSTALLSISAAGMAACGSADSSSTAGGSTGNQGTTASATSSSVKFAMVVTGSKMTPTDKLSATQGQTIVLSFTTDKDEEIHLHGFDYKFDCKAGVAQSMTFAADRTGAFEIEIESTSTHLGELDVNPS